MEVGVGEPCELPPPPPPQAEIKNPQIKTVIRKHFFIIHLF
jgi:hypothetical protein